ncbi:MAG: glycosyltransferase family 39 protein [Chloroflexi bacterium]|nr:glycosyltransferase family 39 protein [Chloroflexota bacterium]
MILLSAGLALRLVLIARPIDDLITLTLNDDAFYYFKIAQHILAGHGASFDGVNLTNGFHPLWLLFSVLSFWLFGGQGDFPIHALLALSALADVLTGFVVYKIVSGITGKVAGALLALAIWCLHLRLIFIAINGMETALNALLVALSLLLFFRLERDSPTRARPYLLTGIVWGLTLLARTDNIMLIVILLGGLLLRRHEVRRVAAASVTATALILPWTIWSLLTFGTIAQASGWAGPMVMRAEFVRQHSGNDLLPALIQFMAGALFYGFTRLYLLFPIRAAWADGGWLLTTAAFGIWLWRRYDMRSREMASQPAFLPAVICLTWISVFISAHVLFRWGTRPYYAYSIAPAIYVVTGIVATWLTTRALTRPERAGLYALGGVLFVLGIIANIDFLGRPHNDHQREMLKAAYWLRDNTAPEAVIGSYNAGLLAYRSSRRVVNLDGVINNAAYEAIASETMAEYVARSKIDYIADFVLNGPDDLFGAYYWKAKPDYRVVYDSDMSGYDFRYYQARDYVVVALSRRAQSR